MPQLYESTDETTTRLSGSIFLYGDKPVYCHTVYTGDDHHPWLKLLILPEQKEFIDVPLNDPQVEFRRYNIGYVNLQDGATFAHRLPARGRYKQGLCKENLAFTPLWGSDGNQFIPRFDHAVNKPAFRDMLLNLYPNMHEAAERLRRGVASVAFDRYFAVSIDKFRKDFVLEYKGERVAFGTDAAFELPEEYRHLRAIFLKHGIKIRQDV